MLGIKVVKEPSARTPSGTPERCGPPPRSLWPLSNVDISNYLNKVYCGDALDAESLGHSEQDGIGAHLGGADPGPPTRAFPRQGFAGARARSGRNRKPWRRPGADALNDLIEEQVEALVEEYEEELRQYDDEQLSEEGQGVS
jgi:hypothetical protein